MPAWIRVDRSWLTAPELRDPVALRLLLELCVLEAEGELTHAHLHPVELAALVRTTRARADAAFRSLERAGIIDRPSTDHRPTIAGPWLDDRSTLSVDRSAERTRKWRERQALVSECDASHAVTVTSPRRSTRRDETRRDELITADRACAREDAAADAAPETGFALTPPTLGTEKVLPEHHPDVVAFVAAWGRVHKAGEYPVAFVWPRSPKARAALAAEIRACMAQSPDWIDTLCTALEMPLIRGEVAPTAAHPSPKPWGPDRILRHWERIVSGEWTSPKDAT